MNRKFTYKILSALSIVLSLGAVVLGVLGVLEGVYSDPEYYLMETLIIAMVFFGLFVLSQIVRHILGRKPSLFITWAVFIFTIICIALLGWFLVSKEEPVIGLLFFSPMFLISYYFYFTNRNYQAINEKDLQPKSFQIPLLFKKINYFRIAILICTIFLLIILNNISKNGRYQKFDDYTIIDTRTGVVYSFKDDASRPKHPYMPND